MIEIKDIIAKFAIKISPKRKINIILKDFFAKKNLPYTGVPPQIKQHTVIVHGDAYLKAYIKSHTQELITLFEAEAPTLKITNVQ
jgi:hypothetical protein